MKPILTIFALTLLSQPVFADDASTEESKAPKKGKWTFGVGVFGASLPHYAGSDQSQTIVLPFPYVRYKSEKLSIDRTGIVQKLWDSESFSLTISGQGAIKVDSKDNKARAGMTDLGWVGAAGPALNWYPSKDKSLFVQLTTRAAFSFDKDIENIGWQGETSLNWASKRQALGPQSSWQFTLKARVKFANSKHNNYFYGVENQYVTATRSSYASDSGYAGTDLLVGINFNGDGYRAGIFARYSNISGATFEDSPLVRKEHNGSIGFSYAWLFSGN
ncbi:MAG: MipA/OmpV family protein [Algicola sp.]|nr:MipA/OmpV family protein [Algicola sp.]